VRRSEVFPADLHYTETHEWARLEDDSIVTVGITQYAAEHLGEIVSLELPEKDENVHRNSLCAEIESVVEVAGFNSPIDGTVVEVNDAVTENPELLNIDPYEAGWVMKVAAKDPAQLDKLMSATQYQAYVAEQEAAEEAEGEEEEEELEEEE